MLNSFLSSSSSVSENACGLLEAVLYFFKKRNRTCRCVKFFAPKLVIFKLPLRHVKAAKPTAHVNTWRKAPAAKLLWFSTHDLLTPDHLLFISSHPGAPGCKHFKAAEAPYLCIYKNIISTKTESFTEQTQCSRRTVLYSVVFQIPRGPTLGIASLSLVSRPSSKSVQEYPSVETSRGLMRDRWCRGWKVSWVLSSLLTALSEL